MQVNRDTLIGEMLGINPEVSDILLEYGMHCIGCAASAGETISEACEVHGIDADELIEDINIYLDSI